MIALPLGRLSFHPWKKTQRVALSATRAIVSHPLRSFWAFAIGIFLLTMVATTTLPIALASIAPEVALFLNPSEPNALMRRAEALRGDGGEFPGPARSEDETPSSVRPVIEEPGPAAGGGVPSPLDAASMPTGSLDAWHKPVRAIAYQIVAIDPLNAAAYALIADTTSDPQQRRELTMETIKRSRREAKATFSLLADNLQSQQFDNVTGYADILLRTRQDLQTAVFALLAQLAEDPKARPAIVQWIVDSPQWRSNFLAQFIAGAKHADAPFALMQELTAVGHPPEPRDLNLYISKLLNAHLAEYAYNVWLQFLPSQRLDDIGFLNDPSLSQNSGTGPFQWRVSAPRNAVAEFVELPDIGDRRAFHVAFGSGRVQFPDLSQTLVLPPGKYIFSNRQRGSIIAKRGLEWGVSCFYGNQAHLGQSPEVLGLIPTWTSTSFEFEVPATDDCTAQIVGLSHRARSASEEFIRGEAWFDDVGISSLPNHPKRIPLK